MPRRRPLGRLPTWRHGLPKPAADMRSIISTCLRQPTNIMGGAHMLSGLALFDRERPNIETGQAWATSNATEDLAAARLCLSYSSGGARILDLRHDPHQRIGWLETAAVMAREIGDQAAESSALSNLGGVYADLGDSARAIEF